MNMIKLTDDFHQFAKARAIPGAFYNRDAKAMVIKEPTPRAAALILKLFPTLVLDYPDLAELRDSLVQDVRPMTDHPVVGWVYAPGVAKALADKHFSFYDFQGYDLGYVTEVLKKHGGAYVGWERGLGKTLGACALIESTNSDRVLVVCPNTAKASVWAPEIQSWLPYHRTIVLRNSKPQREKDLAYAKQLSVVGLPFVLIVHYEVLDIIAGSRGTGWNKFHDFDMVIADEVHRISNPKTKMARALKKIPTHYKVALSGSIIANHAEELFSPLQWLFPKSYSSRWRDWNDRYLDYIDGGWGRICIGVKPDQIEALRAELGVFMVYRRKMDELDLPIRTDQTLHVVLSNAQRKIYNDLINDCMATLPDGTFLKTEAGLVLLGRLRQVATGLSLVSGEVISDSSKLDIAVEMIQDNEDEAFVVFSWYKAAAYELAARLDKLKIDNYVVTGDIPNGARADYIQEFQAGSGRVFIGTISTLGESVTLHRASNAIFLDRSWNPSANDQAADRIYRIGQTQPVTITHLVAKGTVDEFRVQPVIDDKAALRRLILGG